jgi:pSer/pThr/pTyr-binding forkhead associated (FHA) protein
MFLDGVIKTLRAPFEFVRTRVFRVETVKGGIKGDINRLKGVGNQYKQAAGSAGQLAKKAKSGKAAGADGKQKAAKMGLFSKKKKCPSCGEKLHASWDQCPYCGWSEAPSAPVAAAAAPAAGGPSQKMKTMAIDTGAAPVAAGNGVGWLVPLDGPQTGELFQLRGRAIVGTAPDCDVVMKEASISGRHAEFTSTATGFRVSDLGSTNGTFVNDQRVTTEELIDNDNVRLGRVNFKFKSMS